MKENLTSAIFLKNYPVIKNQILKGRYITQSHLEPVYNDLPGWIRIKQEGRSELKVPIFSVSLGKGPIKILGWSQMHGNETTTTKAIFDLINFFDHNKDEPGIADLLNKFSLKILPMLNPDGALIYSRENSNKVDLNRDADLQTQMESKVLRKVLQEFRPQFCFNLHDQRTIFSAGAKEKPATLSFLAPAMDIERQITPNRKKAMQIIAAITNSIESYLPGQIGRYDDAFNINCTGDKFMSLNIPTLLFEAGHFQRDYQREETRKYMAAAIITAIESIAKNNYGKYEISDYQNIPENEKNFFDIILKNARIGKKTVDVAIQYQEYLEKNKIRFKPVIQFIGEELPYYGHRIIECDHNGISNPGGSELSENDIVAEILLNKDIISLKIE